MATASIKHCYQRFADHPGYTAMMNLPHCGSLRDGKDLVQSLINNHEKPNAHIRCTNHAEYWKSGWAKHKLHEHILYGLIKYASKMNRDIWETVDKSSKWIECSHSQAKRWTGRHNSLLGGMIGAQYLDQNILDRCKGSRTDGIPRNFQDNSAADLQLNSMKKSCMYSLAVSKRNANASVVKRRRQRDWSPVDEDASSAALPSIQTGNLLNDFDSRPIPLSQSRSHHAIVDYLQSDSSGLPPKKRTKPQIPGAIQIDTSRVGTSSGNQQLQEMEIEKQRVLLRRMQREDEMHQMELEKKKIEMDKARRYEELEKLQHSGNITWMNGTT
ncbi:hypothetical protein EDC01DRAFT_630529 [Geopyxis carbonaria]|nr:hypothetical protein EDC01DRAFT_630529 [Geopyxis carbonaria]